VSAEEDSFEGRVLRNIGWQALSVFGRLVVSVSGLAVLARIAGPDLMGIYGVAWVPVALGFAVTQSGAAQSIIVLEQARSEHLAAGFTMAVGISCLLGLAMAVLGPLVASFYAQPEAERAFLQGAAVLPLMALGTVDVAAVQKALDFRVIAWVQTLAAVLSAVASIGLAIFWDPLMGLFALRGLTGVFLFVLFRIFGYPAPPLRFSISELRDVWRVGVHLSLNSMTAVMMINLPQLIIAKYLSMEEVGYFTLSRRIIEIVGSQIGGIVNQVIYPSFAAIRRQRDQVAEVFLVTSRYTAFIMVLPLLLLAGSPGDFLALYSGGMWRAGGQVLLLLVLMQMGLALGQNIFPTFQAVGLPSAVWRWNIMLMILQTMLILIFGRESVEATAAAMALSTIVMPLAALWLSRVIGFQFSRWLRSMLKVVLPAVGIAVVVNKSAVVIPGAGPMIRFVLASSIAVVLYLGAALYFDDRLSKLLREVRSK